MSFLINLILIRMNRSPPYLMMPLFIGRSQLPAWDHPIKINLRKLIIIKDLKFYSLLLPKFIKEKLLSRIKKYILYKTRKLLINYMTKYLQASAKKDQKTNAFVRTINFNKNCHPNVLPLSRDTFTMT